MIKTVKLKNAKKRVFNSIQPGATINVEAQEVAGYIRNGFVEVKQAIKDAQQAEKAKAKADAKAKKDAEKAKADAKKQADAQAELDAEYNDANGNTGDDQNDDAEKAESATDVDALNAELETAPKTTKAKAKGGAKAK